MQVNTSMLALLFGYLVGSLSFARIVSRLAAPGKELERVEIEAADTGVSVRISGISATTVGIRLGSRLGVLTSFLDMAKVAAPVSLLRYLYPAVPYYLLSAAGGMVGHIWPLYYGFRGGHGLSAFYGAMLAIDPLGAIVTAIGGMVFGLFIVRDFFTANLSGMWFMIPWLWFRTHSLSHVLYAIAANIFFLLGTLDNIKVYLDARRKGVATDVAAVMQATPMGQGMYKMAARFGVLRPKENSPHIHVRK